MKHTTACSLLCCLLCFVFLAFFLKNTSATAENNSLFYENALISAFAETDKIDTSSFDGFTPVYAQKGSLWADIAIFLCDGLDQLISWLS